MVPTKVIQKARLFSFMANKAAEHESFSHGSRGDEAQITLKRDRFISREPPDAG
jgi:hypothetical protein